jgi:hypothetical protein
LPTFAEAKSVELGELALKADSVDFPFSSMLHIAKLTSWHQCLWWAIESLLYRLSGQSPGAYVRPTESAVNFL